MQPNQTQAPSDSRSFSERTADWLSNNRLVNNRVNNFLANKLPNFAHPVSLISLGLWFPVLAGLTGESVNAILGQTAVITSVAGGVIATGLANQIRTAKDYREHRQLIEDEAQKPDAERSPNAKADLAEVKPGPTSFAIFSSINAFLTLLLVACVGLLIGFFAGDIKLAFGSVQTITMVITLVQAVAISGETIYLDKRQEKVDTIIANDNEGLLRLAITDNNQLRQDKARLEKQVTEKELEANAAKVLAQVDNQAVRLKLLDNLSQLKFWFKQGLALDKLQDYVIDSKGLDIITSVPLTQLVKEEKLSVDNALGLSEIKYQCLSKQPVADLLQNQTKALAINTIHDILNLHNAEINLSNLKRLPLSNAIINELISPTVAVQLQDYHLEALEDERGNLTSLLQKTNIGAQLKNSLHQLSKGAIKYINDLPSTANITDITQLIQPTNQASSSSLRFFPSVSQPSQQANADITQQNTQNRPDL